MDLREWLSHPARRHPWETARARFFVELLARRAPVRPGARILDVGSGDAWFARQLLGRMEAGAQLICWDSAYCADTLAELRRDAPADLYFTTDRPRGRFDLLLCLDVLEHVEDDAAMLRSLVRDSLEPGGRVLVSVPAWPRLFSAHDEALGHHRRYTPRQARALLGAAGLEPLVANGLFHSLLPVRAAQQAALALGLARDLAHLGEWSGGRGLTAAVEAALGLEQRATRAFARLGVEIPGLSWWALCQ